MDKLISQSHQENTIIINSCNAITIDDSLLRGFLLFAMNNENIDHPTTKAYCPQTNGICERFNKTMKQEFFEVAMHKKLYNSK